MFRKDTRRGRARNRDPDSQQGHFDAQVAHGGIPNLLAEHNQLERGLKSRHIQFLALGGAIGTGLFVGSGRILELVGPAPLFLGYLSTMLVAWNVMNNLGEMASYLPLKGISVPYFVERFVEPSLAFAAGWNYWYAYAMLIGAEASAGAIILDYWATPVPPAAWIAMILAVTLGLNIFAVRIFGEAEFFFTSIKLITLLALILTSLVIICGGAPNRVALGFTYWTDPGAFKPYLAAGATGNFLAYWTAFARAGFAFITSPELIALSAGETVAPRRNIPKAARRFVWRLAVFYGAGSLLLGCIVPSTDPQLLSPANDAAASPWVIGMQRAGIHGLEHAINAAILTSAWSAGNAFLYSGSRVLYGLALRGQAPRFLVRTNAAGVPWLAVLATWSVGLLALLNVSEKGTAVFEWFMNISTISGYLAWIVVMITYLRFRAAMCYRMLLDTLPYRTRLQPGATWFILGVLILLTLTNGFPVFVSGHWSTSGFLAAYITLPMFLLLYVGHKIWFRTPLGKKVEDIDVVTGVREMEEMALADLQNTTPPKGIAQKVWAWVA